VERTHEKKRSFNEASSEKGFVRGVVGISGGGKEQTQGQPKEVMVGGHVSARRGELERNDGLKGAPESAGRRRASANAGGRLDGKELNISREGAASSARNAVTHLNSKIVEINRPAREGVDVLPAFTGADENCGIQGQPENVLRQGRLSGISEKADRQREAEDPELCPRPPQGRFGGQVRTALHNRTVEGIHRRFRRPG